MDKPKYRYNWKTRKPEQLYRVNRPLTEIESMIKHQMDMQKAFKIIHGETIQ